MQPLISVIVPVYKVELFLRQCVDSILAQTYSNLEIILVDDGSPDKCGTICDEYACQDPRVRVIHKENGGLSDARNLGIDAARGEYIAFVDSDDWIAPEMYESMYQAAEKYEAGLVVCEYYDCWSRKYSGWHKSENQVFLGEEGAKALLELKFGNYAWNKLYKRELWTPDIRYPVGKNFEDVRTTYKLVQKCETVVVIPQMLYYYRRHGQGITGGNQLRNKIQCADSRMERFEAIGDKYPEQRMFLLKEIYGHFMPLRNALCVQSKNSWKEYSESLDYTFGFLRRHKDEMLRACGFGRMGKVSFCFLCKGTKLGCKMSTWVDKLYAFKQKGKEKGQTKVSEWINKIKAYGKISYYYKWCMHLPLKDSVFIESRGGEDLAGNMFGIAREACSRQKKVYLSVREAYLEKVKAILQTGAVPGLEIVMRGSRKYYKAAGTSKYWFSDMCLDYDFIKRDGQVLVNTWHGTPLKKLEFDIKNDRHSCGGGTREQMKCDYLAVPSQFLFERLLTAGQTENLFGGKALYCGYPRNSIFFKTDERKRVRLEQEIDDKEVFAYMPTWRGTESADTNIYKEYSLEKILDFFEDHLKENQLLFVNLHNFFKGKVDYGKYQRVRPFPADIDTYSMLNAADCLITDYSSVFFDYANTRKKIVLFAYDREEYLKDRGLYLGLNELPFPKVYTFEELAQELDIKKNYDDTEFVRTFCTYDCVDAAQKLLDTVVNKENSCEVGVPPNNKKKNVLIFDAKITYRLLDDSAVRAELESLKPEMANYYYCYRQDALCKTPKYIQTLPRGIYLLTLTLYMTPTLGEKIRSKICGSADVAVSAKREWRKQVGNVKFDEIRILGENEYDPFCRILKEIEKRKTNHDQNADTHN